jgi:broad specificity phosphatase PhoE
MMELTDLKKKKVTKEKKSIVCGSLNPPLTPEGRKQALELAMKFSKKGGINLIICSTQKRAVQTAEIVKELNPSARLIKTPELHSWYMGGLEGKTIEEVGYIIEELLNNPDMVPPGESSTGQKGESLRTYAENYNGAFNVIREHSINNPNMVILVITHRRGMALLTEIAETGGKVTPIKMRDWEDKKNGQVWKWEEGKGKDDKITFQPQDPDGQGGLYVARHGEAG